MKVEFLSRFGKDLDAITSQEVKDTIRQTIIGVEAATTTREIINLKKLKGYKTAYRIRIGEYRIGIFITKNTVEFARVVHRRDIYNVFP